MPLTDEHRAAYAARIESLLKWFAVVHDRMTVMGEDGEVYRRTEKVRDALYELWRVTKPQDGPTSADVSSGPALVPREGSTRDGYPDLSRYRGPKRGRARRSGGM